MTEHSLQRRGFSLASTAGAISALSTSTSAREEPLRPPKEPKSKVPLIDCDFSGGNIVVERVEGDRVYLHQDQRDTPGFWFYWYFRVRRAAGRALTFVFTQGNVIGARGPAVSTDGGRTWTWLGTEAVQGASFTYAFPEKAGDVRFCLAVPYQQASLDEFLGRLRDNPHLKVEHHATTRKGRKNRRLRGVRIRGLPMCESS